MEHLQKTIEEFKSGKYKSTIEMEVFEYKPIECDELIIESEELKDDVRECSNLNSYCCEECFNGFDDLLKHMIEYHFGTLRSSIGTKKELIQKCLEQYDSIQEVSEECWVEESLDYTEEEVNQDPQEATYDEVNIDTLPIQTVTSNGKVFYVSQDFEQETKLINDQNFECLTCNKVFSGLRELQKHEKKHFGPLICDYCNTDFYNRSSLKAHLFKHKAEALGNSNLICTYCEMLFENNEELEAHRIEFHTRNDQTYACESCSRNFDIKFDLMNHIRKSHGDNKKRSCKFCYKKIGDDESLEQHLLEHENQDECVCLHCGKSFKGKKQLRHHIGYYHSQSGYAIANKKRNLRCSVCDKAFTYPNQVRNHEINTHGVGEAAFFCKICKKGYSKAYDLKNHELMHSDLKPFKCQLCPKEFRRQTHLKSHVFNVHTPITEKPDVHCFICQKQFKSIESLRKHLRKIHAMTMNEMYKHEGLPYNGRDILSSKMKMMKKETDSEIQLEEGTIEVEIVGME